MSRYRKTFYNTKFKCIVCDKQVEPLTEKPEGYSESFIGASIFYLLNQLLRHHANDVTIATNGNGMYDRQPGCVNNEMVLNGITGVIEANYGSKHDSDIYLIAICDDCVDEKRRTGGIIFDHNYMFPDEE